MKDLRNFDKNLRTNIKLYRKIYNNIGTGIAIMVEDTDRGSPYILSLFLIAQNFDNGHKIEIFYRHSNFYCLKSNFMINYNWYMKK